MARVVLRGTKRISFEGMLGTPAERRSDLRGAGVEIAVRVQNRTMDGRDEDNRKFTPYTAKYAEWKGVRPSDVTLYLSGDMLNNLDVLDATSRSVAVGFRDRDLKDRAKHNEARGRRFLGVPNSWLTDIKRYYLLKRIARGK